MAASIMLAAKEQRDTNSAEITRDVALATIRNLSPMKHLSDADFGSLTRSVELESCDINALLFRHAADAGSIFYLLTGDVAIFDTEGLSFTISGGDVESKYPLTPRADSCIRAVAKSPVQFMRFPAELTTFYHADREEQIAVAELSEISSELTDRVLFDVCNELFDDDLVLPSLPDVALRIREAATDNRASADDVARIIQTDPGTTAYCISVANSAAVGGVADVDNIRDAVVRLGISTTRDLVVAYTLRSVFSSDGRLAKSMMQAAWKHSCRVAALSYIIARDVARLNPERALLAGLLHDIGITVLIAQCEKHPTIMNDETTFCRIVHELSGQVGAMILRAWRFPDVFIRAIFEAEDFNKPARDRLDLSDTVMLAHLHDGDPAPWSRASTDFSVLAIANKLKDHAISDNDRLAIVEEAQQELRELTLLLNG